MNREDYTKYSSKSEDKVVEVTMNMIEVEDVTVETTSTVEEVEETVVADVDSNVSERKVAAVANGVVAGCTKLNVRERPNVHSPVVVVINEGTKVEIDLDESTNDFYNIYTEFGAAGFCMKKFVRIEPN